MTNLLRHRRPAAGLSASTDVQKNVESDNVKTKTDSSESAPGPSLMMLPSELHLAISEHLIYPDALSLKHTNRHFYSMVDTGTILKVEWLLERRSLHLECPNDRHCELGSDLRFCRGSVP